MLNSILFVIVSENVFRSLRLRAESMEKDTIQHSNSFCYRGHEFTVYAEDDITLGKKWRTNIGVHYTLFKISDKTYHSVEPRVTVRYQWSEHTAIKLSYTEMNQFMHLLSSTYLNLPTDYWMP